MDDEQKVEGTEMETPVEMPAMEEEETEEMPAPEAMPEEESAA